MPDPASSKSAYGKPATDTSFRKTWDKAEYTAKAAEREASDRATAAARREAAAAGKVYHAPRPQDAPTTDTTARSSRLNVASLVGTTTLVPAGAGVGKRGRSAGFYCQDCDLTFKDNLQWVDHLNSKQHLVATGQSGVVERVGVEAVRERLAWLKRKREEERRGDENVQAGLARRLETRAEEEEKEREEKRRKRREARRSKKGGAEEEEVRGGIIAAGAGGEEEVARSMGFAEFGSTRI